MITVENPFTGQTEETHGAFLTYLDASNFLIEEGFSVWYTGSGKDYDDYEELDEQDGEFKSLAFTKQESEHEGMITKFALIKAYGVKSQTSNTPHFNDHENIVEFDYSFPFNDEDQVKQHNELFKDLNGFRPMQSFEEILNTNLHDLSNRIYDIGDEKGWMVGDGVLARVFLQYDPENK